MVNIILALKADIVSTPQLAPDYAAQYADSFRHRLHEAMEESLEEEKLERDLRTQSVRVAREWLESDAPAPLRRRPGH